jgi:hypothetical protein
MFSNYFLATLVIHFWQVADANAKSGEQVESKNHLTCKYSGKPNQFSQEVEAIWWRYAEETSEVTQKTGGKRQK